MSLVGLDAGRAVAELGRWAPVEVSARIAAERAATASIEPAGAAEAITARLAAGGDGR
jgi:hypothetical protein